MSGPEALPLSRASLVSLHEKLRNETHTLRGLLQKPPSDATPDYISALRETLEQSLQLLDELIVLTGIYDAAMRERRRYTRPEIERFEAFGFDMSHGLLFFTDDVLC